MRHSLLHIVCIIVAALLTTSCNYREYCDEFSYEEHARIRYIWEESGAKVLPELLNIEFESKSRANGDIHESANDFFDLALGEGTYNGFAWNPAENITIENRTFYASTNADGSLKSVGELYSGEDDFTLRSSEELEKEDEKDNNHKWSTPPYHNESGHFISYQEVPIIMHAQTRELRIVLGMANNSIDYIQSMSGILEGICQSKDAFGNYLTSSNIHLEFVREGDTMVAVFRVLGCVPDIKQELTFNVNLVDGSISEPIKIDVSNDLSDFNDDMGGEIVTLEYLLDVKKEDTEFDITIRDWDEVIGSADTEIKFTAGTGTAGTPGITPDVLHNTTSSFNIFTSKDNKNFDADSNKEGIQPATSATWVPAQGTEGTTGYIPGYWKNNEPIYWKDNFDDTYFRAFSTSDGKTPSTDSNGNLNLAAGDNDYIWGTSGNNVIHPTTENVALSFEHIMSKVVITVITTDGDDAVDLRNISKQFISNIATTAQFNVANGTYEPFTLANYGDFTLKLEKVPGTSQKKYTYEFYAFPQKLDNNAKVNISVGTGLQTNEFYQQLNTITNDGKLVNEWEAGKRYVYTIRLKKSEQKFTAILTEWENIVTEDGQAEL